MFSGSFSCHGPVLVLCMRTHTCLPHEYNWRPHAHTHTHTHTHTHSHTHTCTETDIAKCRETHMVGNANISRHMTSSSNRSCIDPVHVTGSLLKPVQSHGNFVLIWFRYRACIFQTEKLCMAACSCLVYRCASISFRGGQKTINREGVGNP